MVEINASTELVVASAELCFEVAVGDAVVAEELVGDGEVFADEAELVDGAVELVGGIIEFVDGIMELLDDTGELVDGGVT